MMAALGVVRLEASAQHTSMVSPESSQLRQWKLTTYTASSSEEDRLFEMAFDQLPSAQHMLEHIQQDHGFAGQTSAQLLACPAAVIFERVLFKAVFSIEQVCIDPIRLFLNIVTLSMWGIYLLSFNSLFFMVLSQNVFFTFFTSRNAFYASGSVADCLLHCFLVIFGNTNANNQTQKVAGKQMIEMLKGRFRLMAVLQDLQNCYFMKAGDTMDNFCCQLFQHMIEHQPWKSAAELTGMLHDAFAATQRTLRCQQWSVSLSVFGPEEVLQIAALNHVRLDHQTTWPVSMLITPAALKAYNKVFTQLLRLKRAKWGLDNIRIKGLQALDPTITMPALLMLRMRLVHVVNALHGYIMDRILEGTSSFLAEIQQLCHFDELLTLHERFLNVTHDRCLLHAKAAMIQQAVTRVLQVAIDFRDAWDCVLCGSVTSSGFPVTM